MPIQIMQGGNFTFSASRVLCALGDVMPAVDSTPYFILLIGVSTTYEPIPVTTATLQCVPCPNGTYFLDRGGFPRSGGDTCRSCQFGFDCLGGEKLVPYNGSYGVVRVSDLGDATVSTSALFSRS